MNKLEQVLEFRHVDYSRVRLRIEEIAKSQRQIDDKTREDIGFHFWDCIEDIIRL